VSKYELEMSTNEYGVFFILNVDKKAMNAVLVSWKTLISEMTRHMNDRNNISWRPEEEVSPEFQVM
jgi:Na+/melibiose symporter-like transporter